jgi:hypothetical protein
MMEEDFRAMLLADPGVAAIVGTRITWGSRPQEGALPAIVLHLVGEVPDYSLGEDNGQRESRVQTDCYGTSYSSATATKRATAEALSGFAGPYGSTFFHGIFQDSARDLSEPGGAAEQQRVSLLSMDFLARHQTQE